MRNMVRIRFNPDFNMKLWNIGVRLFKGLGKSRVYHFSSVSLRKKISNNGSKTFLLKWGIILNFLKILLDQTLSMMVC